MEMFAFVFAIIVCSLFALLVYLRIIGTICIAIVESKKKRNCLKKRNGDKSCSTNNQSNKVFKTVFRNAYEGYYRHIVFAVSRIPSHLIRNFYYKKVFKMQIGKNVVIHKGLEIRGGYKITIGDGTIIGDDCILDGRFGLVIGSNVNLSSRASIYTMHHDVDDSEFGGSGGKVFIGDRVWISSNTIVLPGVTIYEGAVLAAGAIATKDLEPFSIYAGVPAIKKRNRNKDLKYNFDGDTIWFN